jgi:carbamoyl-phosphate synthase large subunit
MDKLTIAVTGLNASDNPAPGVPVIRAIREGVGNGCTIVGFSYHPLDSGNYMDQIADHIFLVPFPSAGTDTVLERIKSIHQRYPIDVLIPTLDAELPIYLKLSDTLNKMGIKTFLPQEDHLKLRSKALFYELKTKFEISVPKSVAITDPSAIWKLDQDFSFPVMVKGQFYDAYIAYSPMEVQSYFERIRAKWGVPIVVQEYIAGEEYDIVAVGDGEGGVIGSVPMRKMQLTDKGKAWGGVTVNNPALTDFVTNVFQKLKWRGPCELEIIISRQNSKYYLFEINPRFPAWVFLCVGAGRNLPSATVHLALGKKVERMAPAAPGIMFLRHSFDQICTLSDYESLTTTGELCRGKA